MLLEGLAEAHGPAAPADQAYPIGADLDFRPLLATLADSRNAAYGAALFHATLAAGLGAWVNAPPSAPASPMSRWAAVVSSTESSSQR